MSSKWRVADSITHPPPFPSGVLVDYTARFVDNVNCYESCKNCTRTIYFEETFGPLCPNCKVPLAKNLEEYNFKFKLFLKKEGKFEELQAFRKDLVEFGSSILQDLDTDLENSTWLDLNPDLESRLDDYFEGKTITIEYYKRKGEKFIHKIKEIRKTEVKEPSKKKLKAENI